MAHENEGLFERYFILAWERVHEGAQCLDAHDRDWAKKITRPIVMEDAHECVLGQLFGHYRRGLGALNIDRLGSRNLGFFGCRYETRYRAALMFYYRALSELWEMEREIRLA